MNIQKNSNKLIILVITLMIFIMIPVFTSAAYAEDNVKSPGISIGAGNVEKGNKIYMGVSKSRNSADPISWLVLGYSNMDNPKKPEMENVRLLITEKTQGVTIFNPLALWDCYGDNTWQGSIAQNWCQNFLTDSEEVGYTQNHFSYIEQNTILSTSKKEYSFDLMYGGCDLINESLFFLSVEEVSDDYGYFQGEESRIALRHDDEEPYNPYTAKDWWLRTPYKESEGVYGVVYVSSNGEFVKGVVDDNKLGARPACNFDLNSVLFTSSAQGSKSNKTTNAGELKAIRDNSTNEWKLTLKDYTREFNANAGADATLEMKEGYSDWSIPVVYSGAKTGEKEYVSVILCDSSGEAKYYGWIAKDSAASSDAGQPVTIPEGLEAGSYKMYVFNEQVNGDKYTDYASDFSTIELTVKQTDPTHVRVKAVNPLKIKAGTAAVKYSKLKKKSQTLAVNKVIKFTNDVKDKKTYKLSSAKKGKKSFKKYFKINKTTGRVTIKKGLKKGTYKVKIKVQAKGNSRYRPSKVIPVAFKIKVK